MCEHRSKKGPGGTQQMEIRCLRADWGLLESEPCRPGVVKSKGKGEMAGTGSEDAVPLFTPRCFGRSEKILRRSERITAPQREMRCESTGRSRVWQAEELSQMERLQDRGGKPNGDRATWGKCTAERAK
ncbi:hypothetical protein B0H13DRAFT_1890775 [Mycena leptocephala]|nr:hypothetical protein B0H13DRAFT_1890775 [Mycena leptocephala]